MIARETLPVPPGRVRLSLVGMRGCALPHDVVFPCRPADWTPITGRWLPNLVLYEWGAIVGRQLVTGGTAYKIGGMYIEFENEGDPDTPAVAPGLSRDADQGVAYYNALSTSPDRDYLRVPLVAATLESSDEVKYPKGNLMTFFAQTSGVAGVWGRPFSDASNSRVFGAALVATPDWGDATQDLVLSRVYLDAADQQVKLPTSQVGIEWGLELR